MPDPAAANEAAGPPATPRSRRALAQALVAAGGVAAASAAAWGFLALLVREDRLGRPTLAPLGGFMRALTAAGRWVADLAAARALPLGVAAVAGAAIAIAVLAWRRRDGWRRRGAVALALAAIAAAVAALAAGRLGAGLACSVAAAVGLAGARGEDAGGRPARTRLWLAATLGIAVVLRFWSLAQVPRGYAEHAVVHHVQYTIPFYETLFPALLRLDWRPVPDFLSMLVHEQHAVNSIPAALGFDLLGVGTTQTRLVTAALGSLTVLVAFGLGRRMRDDALGLAFALLLAISPWHVSISRYEDTEHVLCPLQALLALYFTWSALRRGRPRDFVLAGATLAAGWYLYGPSQTMPAIAAAVLLSAVLGGPGLLRRHRVPIAAAIAVFALASAPAIADFIARGRLLPVRSSYQDAAGFRFTDARRDLSMVGAELGELFVAADDAWFARPGGGLGAIGTALLVPGLAWCLWAMRQRGDRDSAVLLLAALPVSFLPAALAPDASFRRLFLFATFALLLAAVAIRDLVGALESCGAPRRLVAALCLGAAAVATAAEAHVYFDLCQLPESETHRYHYEMARFAAGDLGERFVTVVVPHEWDVADHERYLTLVGYERLRALAARGRMKAGLYRIVTAAQAEAALRPPAAIAGRGTILAERTLADAAVDGVDLPALVRRDCPACRASARLDARDPRLFVAWEFGPAP